jgi:hypothetical protein
LLYSIQGHAFLTLQHVLCHTPHLLCFPPALLLLSPNPTHPTPNCRPPPPPPFTAAPSVLEMQTAVNLADVGKCNCTYTWCAAVSAGRLALASSNASAAQLTGPVPTSPYAALASQPRMQCNNRSDPANPCELGAGRAGGVGSQGPEGGQHRKGIPNCKDLVRKMLQKRPPACAATASM